MSFFDKLARWLGLSETAAADQPPGGGGSAAVPAGAAQPPPLPPALGGHGPYAELWQSVDRHLAQFMVRSVLPHRQFEPDDVFRLVRIQITGTTAAAQAAIDRFLTEFRPDSRRKVVLAAVRRNCPQGVSSENFVDFNRDFDSAELEDSDPYDAQLAPAHQGGYQLTLHGEWQLQPTSPGSAQQPAGAGDGADAQSAAAALEIDVHDAGGRRALSVPQLPFVVGRNALRPELAIAGQFVSRRHGLLERDGQGRVWYRDTSVNGSSVDGVATMPGERRQLGNGARLRLGGDVANPRECPELVVHWPAAGDNAAADADDAPTPIRAPLHPGGTAATPIRADIDNNQAAAVTGAVTPLAGPSPGPLCLLAIKDAHGSRTVPVTRLPYVVGRGEQADCRIPEDNAGVSREHLVLRALTGAGAQLDNNAAGKWGTLVDGVEQPARFTLGWGRQATLASRFENAPAVTVQLLPSAK